MVPVCMEQMGLKLLEILDAVVLHWIKPTVTPSFFLGKPSPEWDMLRRSVLSAGALAVLGAATSLTTAI